MILLDTSGLLAALTPSQRTHSDCARALAKAQGPYLLSPFVLAELDHLIRKLVGPAGELALLKEVATEAYELVSFGAVDIARIREIVEKYSNQDIGLADASLVVLSERFGMTDLLTLDECHFRVLQGAGGAPFRILPADG